MINRDGLIQDLGPLGTVVYCDYNNEWSYIVVMEDVTEQLFVDGIVNAYLSTEFSSFIPSTLENGIYKISYDNFPN
jgi:hypothetical protein